MHSSFNNFKFRLWTWFLQITKVFDWVFATAWTITPDVRAVILSIQNNAVYNFGRFEIARSVVNIKVNFALWMSSQYRNSCTVIVAPTFEPCLPHYRANDLLRQSTRLKRQCNRRTVFFIQTRIIIWLCSSLHGILAWVIVWSAANFFTSGT